MELKPNSAKRTAEDAISFIYQMGGDVKESVRRELQANDDRVQRLLDRMRKSTTKNEIEKLGKCIADFIAYGQELKQAVEPQSAVDEGSIHIVSSELGGNRPPAYLVMFGRYFGPGGAMKPRAFAEEGDLRNFLSKEVHIDQNKVDEAIQNLNRSKSTSIHNVVLSKDEQKKLELL